MSNWVQKITFTTKQVVPKIEFLDKKWRFGTF